MCVYFSKQKMPTELQSYRTMYIIATRRVAYDLFFCITVCFILSPPHPLVQKFEVKKGGGLRAHKQNKKNSNFSENELIRFSPKKGGGT